MYWEDLIRTWMHDPPDKALRIQGHESRARRYLAVALDIDEKEAVVHGGFPDRMASALERLPTPHHRNGEIAVGPVCHPLSGVWIELHNCQIDESIILESIKKLTSVTDDVKIRFLALWRFLPEKLSKRAPFFQLLPADTRIPDHSIWNHLDVTTALSLSGTAVGGMALLSFCIGGAQDFIAGARTLRDLWSGSAILSWLCFKAMEPIIDEYGPTSVIYPSLRGNPLMDRWLYQIDDLRALFEEEPVVKTPALPNRFLALIHWGREGENAFAYARKCEEAVNIAWQELSQKVQEAVRQQISGYEHWDELWNDQVRDCFEFRVAVLPRNKISMDELPSLLESNSWNTRFQEVNKIKELARILAEDDQKWRANQPSGGSDRINTPWTDSIGEWQALSTLSARLMEAQRSVGHFPNYSPLGEVPQKCTLWGTYEQMGPAKLTDSTEFWNTAISGIAIQGIRLRSGDRLSAPALVKRFALPVMLSGEFGFRAFKTPDTATLAASIWISNNEDVERLLQSDGETRWNGQWLHWPKPDQDSDEDPVPAETWSVIQTAKKREKRHPPAYYAVMVLDGDEMGKWLSGQNAPSIGSLYHSKIRSHIESLTGTLELMRAKRPVIPAMHTAISEALSNYACHIVPSIVESHRGFLVYAGGDDVLALLPTESALSCALELRNAFMGEGDLRGDHVGFCKSRERNYLMMGPKATVSAGIAIAHYKENLRDVLQAARSAEKHSKDSGRNTLTISLLKRSGEHLRTLCPWEIIPGVLDLLKAFVSGASDRWAYQLRAEEQVLGALCREAVMSETKRLVNRSEKETRELLGETRDQTAGDKLAALFDQYLKILQLRARDKDEGNTASLSLLQPALSDFIGLVQVASFLARGRD